MGDPRVPKVQSRFDCTDREPLGDVIGVCDLVDCVGPLKAAEFRRNAKKAGMRPGDATLGYYRQTYAWVVKNPRRLTRPVEYRHPPGAVIWVRLGTAGGEKDQSATRQGVEFKLVAGTRS